MCYLSCYSCINCLLSGEHQLRSRTLHSTIVSGDKLYCWGGNQEDLPRPFVHDSKDKKKITSSIDIFDFTTFKWKRISTTGSPPLGVMSYACTNIGNNILYFGGDCKRNDCYHNNLFKLSALTDDIHWSEIVCTTPHKLPMRKIGCGMTYFDIDREEKLFLCGGVGPTPLTTQTHSQYISFPGQPNLSCTNEMHIMNLSTSQGITLLNI